MRTSWLDVRIVERARPRSAGHRSTAAYWPLTPGGSEVVVFRSLIRPRGRTVAAAFVIVLAVGASACGGESKSSTATTTTRPPSTTSTSGPTTSSSAPDDTAVRSAYEAASRAFIDAAAIPDPNFAAVAATHTGPMLEQTRNLLRALQADGRFIRYPLNSQYRIDVKSVDVTGDVARMSVCVVDDGERVERASGRVIAGGVVTVQWTAAMRRAEGVWRLAERREEGRWDGVAGCAAG